METLAKTTYEQLSEMGLLHTLTDGALEATYKEHIAQRKKRAANYNVAQAEVFNWMQRNDPDALSKMMRNEPRKFQEMQESYLLMSEARTK